MYLRRFITIGAVVGGDVDVAGADAEVGRVLARATALHRGGDHHGGELRGHARVERADPYAFYAEVAPASEGAFANTGA